MELKDTFKYYRSNGHNWSWEQSHKCKEEFGYGMGYFPFLVEHSKETIDEEGISLGIEENRSIIDQLVAWEKGWA